MKRDPGRRDPYGVLRPTPVALAAWRALGERVASILGARLMAFDPGFLFSVDGHANTWSITAGAASRIVAAVDDAAAVELSAVLAYCDRPGGVGVWTARQSLAEELKRGRHHER